LSNCHLETATPFFERARKLSGKKLLCDLLDENIILQTLDAEYRDHMPSTLDTVLAAIGKVHMGCRRLSWIRSPSPVTPELRKHVKAYRDDGDVHLPRFGYEEGDAVRIVELLKEKRSSFALAAEVALGCGLRIAEIAGLKGKDADKEHGLLHIEGRAASTGMSPCWLRSPSSWIRPSRGSSGPPNPGNRRSSRQSARQPMIWGSRSVGCTG
jgi:integrase